MQRRAATLEDLAELKLLIQRSAEGLSLGHYSTEQVSAALPGAFGGDVEIHFLPMTKMAERMA